MLGSSNAVADAEFVFLCVQTPQGEDGSADLQHVLAAARSIGRHSATSTPVIVVSRSFAREMFGSESPIGRRVDALSVVHRHHYAEMEENRGIALRPLLTELELARAETFEPISARAPMKLSTVEVSARPR